MPFEALERVTNAARKMSGSVNGNSMRRVMTPSRNIFLQFLVDSAFLTNMFAVWRVMKRRVDFLLK